VDCGLVVSWHLGPHHVAGLKDWNGLGGRTKLTARDFPRGYCMRSNPLFQVALSPLTVWQPTSVTDLADAGAVERAGFRNAESPAALFAAAARTKLDWQTGIQRGERLTRGLIGRLRFLVWSVGFSSSEAAASWCKRKQRRWGALGFAAQNTACSE
jgi:hypothetical protein